jgi:fermentation-respiration switch protein FrsA (DUF1100 family)
VAAIIKITEFRLGVRLERVIPAEYIGRFSPIPVLLLTGSEDDHADVHCLKRLFERCGEPRELWVVLGAHHADVFEVAGKSYGDHVLDFLRRRLRR